MGSCQVADVFCAPTTRRALLEALEKVTKVTSGDVRLYFERHCEDDQLDRAGALFLELGLDDLGARRAVLLYVAVSDGKLAFVADPDVVERVGAEALGAPVKQLVQRFAAWEHKAGVVEFVEALGRSLAGPYPPTPGEPPSTDAHLLMGDLNEW